AIFARTVAGSFPRTIIFAQDVASLSNERFRQRKPNIEQTHSSMAHISPSNPPPTRLPQFYAQLRIPALLRHGMPILADLYHQGDIAQVRHRTLSALRLVFLLTVPVTIGGVLLTEPLTRLAYEYGRFRTADTLLTAQAVRAYLMGLPFYGTVHLLNRCFYATHDTMTPAMVNLGALGLNI